MRLAVSGAHRTGKTTLVAALAQVLPGFTPIDEPYYLLEAEGHVFEEFPVAEDFELQLERSIEILREAEGDCLFDRCPADMLAYLTALEDSAGFDYDEWLPAVREAMQSLDLVIFVPIEDPDRIAMDAAGRPRLRRRVNDELRDIILDDSWGFGVPALEVTGSPDERANRVLAHLDDRGR